MAKPSILIVGAGPVGLTAALELQRRGFSPSIIDQKQGPVVESRALAVNPRSLAILTPSGLAERFIAAGKKIQRVYLRGSDRLLLTVKMESLPGPHNFMLVLPQDQSEALLAQAVNERGLEIAWGHKLTDLHRDGETVTAVIQDPDGGVSEQHPDLVIGADGAHSTVRRAIGQDFKGSAYDENFGLVDGEVATDLPLDGLNVFDRSPRLFAMFPIRDRRVRLISDHEDFMDHLPPEIRITEVHWQSPFRISHRLVDSYQDGPVFLVGDAAHIHSPLGGRGMNLGMEDAAWLAWLIAEGRTEGFTAARRPVAEHLIKTVDPATRFMASDKWGHRLLRRHVLPLIGALPFVQERLLPNVTASNTPFPPWLENGG